MVEARTAIWPHDILRDPPTADREGPSHLCCFLICPFSPADVFDDLYSLIQQVCDLLGQQLACRVECVRADRIASSGVIQAEIWHQIQSADAVIADVTGLNPNVLIELGVASACRRKEHVVIIKEDNPNERFVFDIGPARHIVYKRTSQGYQRLFTDLHAAPLMPLTTAPFEIEATSPLTLPFSVNLSDSRRVDWLTGPVSTHRRLLPDSLEFGSLFVFRNSWISIGSQDLSKFGLAARMRFSQLRDLEAWVGISVRSHHFFANFGHLIYLTSTGKVVRTVPEDDLGKYHDEVIGELPHFDVSSPVYHDFHIEVDDEMMNMAVDGVGGTFKLSEMPFVYASGRILFQTCNCRGAINSIKIWPK